MKYLAILFFFLPTLKAQDIVDTAISAGSFNTLVAAVQAAGLEDALRGDGPFTVFAPTDDAFAQLPAETIDALLADPETLGQILLYHVASGEFDAGQVVSSSYLTMLTGQPAIISTESGPMISDANIIVTDIQTDNGIIHVIDNVILPPDSNIVELASGAGIFNTLLAAATAAGLADTLSNDGPFTVFAPTDDAFGQLPADTIDALLNDIDALTEILLYHVVSGNVLASDVVSNSRIPTLQGQSLKVSLDGGVFVDDAQVTATDLLASNGVVHVIDQVLLPPEKVGVTYEVTVTNLTKGQVFSPPAIVSHSKDVSLFQLGAPASDALAALAEDGMTDPLVNALSGSDLIFDINAFTAPLQPGESASATILVDPTRSTISVAGMLVSTNDTFFATESSVSGQLNFFKSAGFRTVTELAWAYDAGTEGNNEDCGFIPGPPCGNAGIRDEANAEGYVYISPGISGEGDLLRSQFDWNGPVAVITIERL